MNEIHRDYNSCGALEIIYLLRKTVISSSNLKLWASRDRISGSDYLMDSRRSLSRLWRGGNDNV